MIVEYFQILWFLLVSVSAYILLGLIFVGIMHLYITEDWIKKHLGGEGWKSVLKAAIYGIPLPLCSCGVIPLATSLHRSGASKGSVTSFFITTPMTGLDSIFATYGVFGLPMAIIRVVGSFISGIVAGLWVGGQKQPTQFSNAEPAKSCCSDCGCSSNEPKKSTFKKVTDYVFMEVFADIAKPMTYGLLLAAVLVMIFPEDASAWLSEIPLLAYFGALLIGLPIYVCSVSAIPMALGMIAAGLSPGIAFVFLAAAPATNVITAGVINKILGKKALVAYLVSIISITICFAFAIDYFLPSDWFATIGSFDSESHSLIEEVSAVIFIVLTGFFLLPLRVRSKITILFSKLA